MFAYNPGVIDRSGEFLAQGMVGAAQANQQMYEQLGENVGGTIRKAGAAAAGFAMGGPAGAAMAMQGGGERGGRGGGGAPDSILSSIVGAYAENKAMETKAKSYDKIADILGSSMFSGNRGAMQAFADLRATEDPREKVMGYEQLFSMLGPMSNMMMAQNRLGVQQDQQQLTATLPERRAQAEAEATRRREGRYISGTALPGFQ